MVAKLWFLNNIKIKTNAGTTAQFGFLFFDEPTGKKVFDFLLTLCIFFDIETIRIKQCVIHPYFSVTNWLILSRNY